jgi:hypothetical protein
MLHLPTHLLQALLTQRLEQLLQATLQLDDSETGGQRATHRLRLTCVLVPPSVTDLPQVQRQLPMQRPRQIAQAPYVFPIVAASVVCALFKAQTTPSKGRQRLNPCHWLNRAGACTLPP